MLIDPLFFLLRFCLLIFTPLLFVFYIDKLYLFTGYTCLFSDHPQVFFYYSSLKRFAVVDWAPLFWYMEHNTGPYSRREYGRESFQTDRKLLEHKQLK